MILSIPNLITFGRILVIPLVAALMMMVDPQGNIETNRNLCFWAMVVFIIAAVSDLVDGYYARKYGEVSVMGKFIDPMADKLIHMAVMVLLIPLERIPAWMVVVLLFREIFVNGLRAVAAGEGLVIGAASWGKKKTAWLNFGLGSLILHYPYFVGTAYEFDPQVVGMICMSIGFVYSVASAVFYTKDFFVQVIVKK